jgi:predicted transcriptional regulator
LKESKEAAVEVLGNPGRPLPEVIFRHPYAKNAFVEQEMNIARNTAVKYLEALTEAGILDKVKIGRENYYFNLELIALLSGQRSAP